MHAEMALEAAVIIVSACNITRTRFLNAHKTIWFVNWGEP